MIRMNRLTHVNHEFHRHRLHDTHTSTTTQGWPPRSQDRPPECNPVLDPFTAGTGALKVHPATALKAQAATLNLRFAGELGLSPAARQSLIGAATTSDADTDPELKYFA